MFWLKHESLFVTIYDKFDVALVDTSLTGHISSPGTPIMILQWLGSFSARWESSMVQAVISYSRVPNDVRVITSSSTQRSWLVTTWLNIILSFAWKIKRQNVYVCLLYFCIYFYNYLIRIIFIQFKKYCCCLFRWWEGLLENELRMENDLSSALNDYNLWIRCSMRWPQNNCLTF